MERRRFHLPRRQASAAPSSSGSWTDIPVERAKPDAPESVALVGFDAQRKAYIQHYFDVRGLARIYAMGLREGAWTLVRESADFTPLGFSQRFTGMFSSNGTRINGRWESSPDGSNWKYDFYLTYTKVREPCVQPPKAMTRVAVWLRRQLWCRRGADRVRAASGDRGVRMSRRVNAEHDLEKSRCFEQNIRPARWTTQTFLEKWSREAQATTRTEWRIE
jgi:hypothetical protein